MSKFKINDKIQFIDLAEHIKPNKSYNVTILEAKVRETGFTDRQLEQLGKIVTQIIAATVPPLIETALAPIIKRLDRLEDFAIKQLAFNEEQRIINAEQKKFNEEQREYNKKIDRIEILVERMALTPTMKRELAELDEAIKNNK